MAAALGALIFFLLVLQAALERIDEQQSELENRQELIDEKETFGAAMNDLLETTTEFDGVLATTIVPLDDYEVLASRAWAHRWDAAAVRRDTAEVRIELDELELVLAAAEVQATTNASGTTNEAVIDRLGAGFVTSAIDDADTLCETDVLGCVVSDDPYTVHFDAADLDLPYMDDRQRQGLAYHEFAHVLQFTNPEATEVAVEAFGGDVETMADCYALTYLDGWTLDSRVWINSYLYYNVSMGYGHTCDETERQAVIDWYSQLGFHPRPISQ